MRMSFGQEMRLAQKQVLAPRMIQSMEILQLPTMALEERIEQEIQNNETLEVDDSLGDAAIGDSSEGEARALATTVDAADPAPERTAAERPLVVDQDHANQVAGLRGTIDAIFNSRSWRYTAPLRKVSTLLRDSGDT